MLFFRVKNYCLLMCKLLTLMVLYTIGNTYNNNIQAQTKQTEALPESIIGKLKSPPTIEMTIGKGAMIKGVQPYLQVNVPLGNIEEVLSQWKEVLDTMGGRTTTKKHESGNYLFADNCRMLKVSDHEFDVYTTFSDGPLEKGVFMRIYVDLGGAFLEPMAHAQQFNTFSTYVFNFARISSLKAISERLHESRMALYRLERERKSIKQEQDEMKVKIAQIEKELNEMKTKLETVQKSLDKNTNEAESTIIDIEQNKKSQNAIEKAPVTLPEHMRDTPKDGQQQPNSENYKNQQQKPKNN